MQINSITGWLDASMVYGSDQFTSDNLRVWSGGLLTSDNNLPPQDPNAPGFFQAGDKRMNENIFLSSFHTLFLR